MTMKNDIYSVAPTNIYTSNSLTVNNSLAIPQLAQDFTNGIPNYEWLKYWTSKRIRHNKSVLGAVTGPTGSGKSYFSLGASERYNPDFSVDDVVFNTKDFLNTLNTKKKGDVIIFDDAGLGIGARQWWEDQVMIFGKIVQSMRFKQVITYLTMPDIELIEKQSRLLLDIIFQAHENEQGRFYVKLPKTQKNYNLKSHNIYFIYPRIYYHGSVYKIQTIKYPMPSKKLVDAYEKKRQEYVDSYYAEYTKTLAAKRTKHTYNPKSLNNLLIGRTKRQSQDL